MLVGFGLLMIAYGAVVLRSGAISYRNFLWQMMFSPGVIAIGGFLCVMALLPPGKWMYPLITTKKRRTIHR